MIVVNPTIIWWGKCTMMQQDDLGEVAMYIYGILSEDTLSFIVSYHPMNYHGVNHKSIVSDDFFMRLFSTIYKTWLNLYLFTTCKA